MDNGKLITAERDCHREICEIREPRTATVFGETALRETEAEPFAWMACFAVVDPICEVLCESVARWSVPPFSRISRVSRSRILAYSRVFPHIPAFSGNRGLRRKGACRADLCQSFSGDGGSSLSEGGLAPSKRTVRRRVKVSQSKSKRSSERMNYES